MIGKSKKYTKKLCIMINYTIFVGVLSSFGALSAARERVTAYKTAQKIKKILVINY